MFEAFFNVVIGALFGVVVSGAVGLLKSAKEDAFFAVWRWVLGLLMYALSISTLVALCYLVGVQVRMAAAYLEGLW